MISRMMESRLGRRVVMGAAALGTTGAVLVANTPAAHAWAYTMAAYAPNKINSYQAQGWAYLSRDCSGTLGCYNYIRMDVMRWYGPSMVNGWWANNNGWNSITGTLLSGCYNYRTHIDSYNYATGDWGGGVNVGSAGFSVNGQTVYEFHSEWASGWKTICR